MNIGIDITGITYGRGVSRYTSNLVSALAELGTHQLQLLGYSWRQRDVLQAWYDRAALSDTTDLTLQPIPPKLQSWLWRFGLNRVGNSLSPMPDVFHSWDWLQPPDTKIPLVSTIHDLAMLKFPETAHPEILAHHQRSWKILKQRRAQLIAVSRATKRDLVELLEYPSELISVVYEALPQEVEAVSQNMTEEKYQAIKQRLDITQPFILAVGTREPRKNLTRLIEAWQPLANDFQLVIAGAAGWDDSDQLADLAHQPRFLGRVSDQALHVLYAEADIFAYPSMYEGFGLPILEAFYHGTPVVTSDTSSMSEIAGNAAILVDPESTTSITKGLKKIASEDPVQQQARLQKMVIRRHLFSWQKVATETIKVYQQAQDAHES